MRRSLRRCGCGLNSRHLSRVLSGKRSFIHCGLWSRFNCRTPRGLWCTIACFWITHWATGTLINLIRHQLACLKGIASVVRFNPGNSPTASVTATQTIITSESVPHSLSTLRAAAVSWLRNRSGLWSRDVRRFGSGPRSRQLRRLLCRDLRRFDGLLSRDLRRFGSGPRSRRLRRLLSWKLRRY